MTDQQRIKDLEHRAKQARGYLKLVHTGAWVSACLVVAAIRTLDPKEKLPLGPPKRKHRRSSK